MNRNIKKIVLSIVIGLTALTAPAGPAAGAQALTVRAAVEDPTVYLGQPFLFQIQIEGSDKPSSPDLSAVKDFTVQPMGGQKNNSSSVTIINGQMSQVERVGYLFMYKLTAKRLGSFLIPALEVRAAGQSAATNPIAITVRKPQETPDLKLRQELSRTVVYVGEPATLTVTLYLGKDIRSLDFNLPILENRNLNIVDPDFQTNIPGRYVKLPLGAGSVIAEKGQGELDGRTFTTFSFRKILVPKQAGVINIPAATAACDIVSGYRDPESFFSDRGVYQKCLSTSNPLMLEVKNLPEAGRPAEFSGYVGEYRMEARAVPTRVNVGDPITLTIKVSGSEYLKTLELPSLNRQKNLADNFKIPEEMAPGKVEDGVGVKGKVFTQTLRALRPSVKEIPPIELSYFNSKTGKYQVARTRAIPLIVNDAKVLTARDAEGREIMGMKTELETWQQGIAHNFEDWSVLENQNYTLSALIRSPVFILINGIPAAGYLILLISLAFYRRAHADLPARKARAAYRELTQTLNRLSRHPRPEETQVLGEVLVAVKNYLGAKLRILPGSLTSQDVENRLLEKGIRGEMMTGIKEIFARCEADRYAGGTALSGSESAEFIRRVLETMGRLEERLK